MQGEVYGLRNAFFTGRKSEILFWRVVLRPINRLLLSRPIVTTSVAEIMIFGHIKFQFSPYCIVPTMESPPRKLLRDALNRILTRLNRTF
jgi:hypothetical protein